MTTSIDDVTTTNQVLSHYDIHDEMTSTVCELEPLLPITPIQRELLLLKFNWDIESLKNSLQQYVNTNSFLIENGVCPESTVSVIKSSECEICCSPGKLLGLRCQHMACFNCWTKYLAAKIRNGQCILKCMEFGCCMMISNEILGSFLRSSKLKIAHRKLVKESFMSSHASLAWCNKKCGMAVRRFNNDIVTCSCGSAFCFLCRSDNHYPATCLQFRLWEKQRMDSGQKTSSWIMLNTRECPRCFIPIQKNGGCNHMTCPACRHEYCWVCTKNWGTHPQFGGCKQTDIAMARSRFNSRGNSSTFAQHLKLFEHQKQCLKESVLVLSAHPKTVAECRRTLMYSYVFGYYLKDRMCRSLLEEHQQKLEDAVDNLAVFTFDIDQEMLAEECLTLRDALLAYCAEVAEHEDLEVLQPPVESVTTDTGDCVKFSGAMIFGVCFVVVMLLGLLVLAWVFC